MNIREKISLPLLKERETVIPDQDMTDLGNGKMYARCFSDIAGYSKSEGWIIFDGKKWNSEQVLELALAADLSDMQVDEIKRRMQKLYSEHNQALAEDDDAKKAAAEAKMKKLGSLKKAVDARRNAARLDATIKTAKAYLPLEIDDFDADPYLLNTPGGTVDLSTGIMHPHKSSDRCTKITRVTPGLEGKEMWEDFVNQLAGGDQEMVDYLQEVAGMCLVEDVYREQLTLLYGSGGNGKSTFTRALLEAMGSYATVMDSEVLTDNNRSDKRFALGHLRGVRLLLIGELRPGVRLDRAIVTRLSSSDRKRGELKFKEGAEFDPRYTTVVHTNHLPDVDVEDIAIWDRMVVIPFTQRFRNREDTKYDLSKQIRNHALPYVLAWAIEGAKRHIAKKYQFNMPECVKLAISDYRHGCNSVLSFVNHCCIVDANARVQSSTLYAAYRNYVGEASAATIKYFHTEIEAVGYTFDHRKDANYIVGLKLKDGDLITQDKP